MKETWKDVVGLEGKYIISSIGNIAYKNSVFRNSRKKYTSNTGYFFITHGGRSYFIHRLVAKAFIPNPENKKQVNHKNGDKKDNRVENLEWCTRIENIHHAINNGLFKSSTAITRSDVLKIRRLYKTGDYTYKELAEKLNVSKTSVHNIVKFKQRADVI